MWKSVIWLASVCPTDDYTFRNIKARIAMMTLSKRKHFLRYWPFVRGIHWWPVTVDSPHKGQWCGALIFSLLCTWTNDWANNRDAADLKHHRSHYVVTVMTLHLWYITLYFILHHTTSLTKSLTLCFLHCIKRLFQIIYLVMLLKYVIGIIYRI